MFNSHAIVEYYIILAMSPPGKRTASDFRCAYKYDILAEHSHSVPKNHFVVQNTKKLPFGCWRTLCDPYIFETKNVLSATTTTKLPRCCRMTTYGVESCSFKGDALQFLVFGDCKR